MVQATYTTLILELVQIAVRENVSATISALFLERLFPEFSPAEAGSVWLYSPEAAALAVSTSRGYTGEALRQIRLRHGTSFVRSFFTGQPKLSASPVQAAELINELPASQRALYRAAAGVQHPQSVIIAPLHAGEITLGVLVLENLRGALRFTADDLERLQPVADLLALALSRAQLQTALREAQAANEASNIRRESIAFLAHEMRTPLTSIKGYATALLMDEVKFDASAQREFLEQIDRECDSLIHLIEDLLESSILDAGKLELELEPVRLPRLVKEVVDELDQTSTRHRFLVEFPREFPLVRADPTRLAQVVRNLLENAIKYSPQGGLIVVRGEMELHQIMISVADQGIGIAPEHLNRLFEKFFRVKTGATQPIIGSGLGLPIARSIVQAHGGKIWAESHPGQGSTFYVTLPLIRPATEMDAEGDEPDE